MSMACLSCQHTFYVGAGAIALAVSRTLQGALSPQPPWGEKVPFMPVGMSVDQEQAILSAGPRSLAGQGERPPPLRLSHTAWQGAGIQPISGRRRLGCVLTDDGRGSKNE